MLLVFPPAVDIDHTITQVKYEIVEKYNTSSTCLESPYKRLLEDDSILHWEKVMTLATNVSVEDDILDNNSTWEDLIANEFELLSTIRFTKAFKVKSKIKRISTYVPKIVLE